MTVNDIGKMVLLTVALLAGAAIAITGILTDDTGALTAGVGLCATALGYLAGNGVNAARVQAPSPVLVPTSERIEAQAAEVEAEARSSVAP